MMNKDDFDLKTRKPIHLVCRKEFIADDGTVIEDVDYAGFKIKTPAGQQRVFLLPALVNQDMFAIDVTDAARRGQFAIIDPTDT